MPDRTKPSRACELCRQKRRKCDMKMPSCSQCVRAKASCAGYRDEFTLRLRDETVSTGRKVQSSSHPQQPHSFSRDDDEKASPGTSRFPSGDWQTVRAKGSTMSRLAVAPEYISFHFFMRHYASYSLFDYLPELCRSGTLFDKRIEQAIMVPALALLSHQINDPKLLRLAYARYARLLKETHQALPASERAKSDRTLVTVLCLALFEAMSLQGNQEMKNWNAHINGASALLELRGSHQFDTWLGRRLYLHASHSISASCVIKGTPAAPALLEVDKKVPLDDPKFSFAVRRGRLLRLLAEYRQSKSSMTRRERLLMCKHMIEDIETQMEEMNATDPVVPLDPPSMRRLPDSAKLSAMAADSYSSIRWAQAWNILRMLNIFMSDGACTMLDALCLDYTPRVPPTDGQNDDDDDYDLSRLERLRVRMAARVEASIEALLRSVPYFIDLSEEARFTARSLIGPLYAAASCRLIRLPSKEFAVNRLYHIGESYGLAQAIEAAKHVDSGSNFDSWQVLSSFGRVYGLC